MLKHSLHHTSCCAIATNIRRKHTTVASLVYPEDRLFQPASINLHTTSTGVPKTGILSYLRGAPTSRCSQLGKRLGNRLMVWAQTLHKTSTDDRTDSIAASSSRVWVNVPQFCVGVWDPPHCSFRWRLTCIVCSSAVVDAKPLIRMKPGATCVPELEDTRPVDGVLEKQRRQHGHCRSGTKSIASPKM